LGVPGFLLYVVEPRVFLATPKKVVNWTRYSEVRHVLFERFPFANPKPTWYWESVCQ